MQNISFCVFFFENYSIISYKQRQVYPRSLEEVILKQHPYDDHPSDHLKQPNQTCLESWLERATAQENQARNMRTNIVLAGVTSYFLAIASSYFTDGQLLFLYCVASVILLTSNQFYGKKTAAWCHAAREIQHFQLGEAHGKVGPTGKFKTCDELYLDLRKNSYNQFVRIDGPTITLFLSLAVGLFVTLMKFLETDEKIFHIYEQTVNSVLSSLM